MKSESIDKLAQALSKAQAVIEGAELNSENPFHKSSYPNLMSIWRAARKPLTDNGLCVVQTTAVYERGPVLVTTLIHTSGQWIDGEYPIVSMKQDPQSLVAATTYARRAALAAIVGISPQDCDGEGAMDRAVTGAQAQPAPAKPLPNHAPQAPKPAAAPSRPQAGANLLAKTSHTGGSKFTKISEKQANRLMAIGKSSGMTNELIYTYLRSKVGHENPHDVSPADYDEICKGLADYKAYLAVNPNMGTNPPKTGDDWTTGLSEPLFDKEETLPF